MTTYLASHGNAVLVAIIMLLLIIPQIFLIKKKGWEKFSFRILGFSIIASFGVLAALIIGEKQNATAVFGLLGTIAGYIIGKSEDG